MTSAEAEGFRVQLIGGPHDGDANTIIKIIPKISVGNGGSKFDHYILTGAHSASGEVLYVHEDIVAVWRGWRKC